MRFPRHSVGARGEKNFFSAAPHFSTASLRLGASDKWCPSGGESEVGSRKSEVSPGFRSFRLQTSDFGLLLATGAERLEHRAVAEHAAGPFASLRRAVEVASGARRE